MRISPNHPRLRVTALACWAIGAVCLVHGGFFSLNAPALLALTVSTQLLGFMLLALGIAFWLLATDQRAGVVFDHKGLLLNLGNSSAFIGWQNIERAGVSAYRSQLLAIGSRRQFGIKLRDTERYVQSYEARLPAANGLLGRTIRVIETPLRRFRVANDQLLRSQLAQNRDQTGFDVLIPESLLGGRAEDFAELVATYRNGKN